MKHDKHDRKLRAKFESYTPRVDELDLWEGIEAALPQPKRKRRYFIPLFAVVLLGCISILMLPNKDESPKENNSARNIAAHHIGSIEQTENLTLNEAKDAKSIKTGIAFENKIYNQKDAKINDPSQRPNKSINEIKKEKPRLESKSIYSTIEIPSIIDNKAPTRITKSNPVRNKNVVAPLPTNYNLMPLETKEKGLKVSLEQIPIQYTESELRSRWTLGINAAVGKAISDYSNSTIGNEIGKESLAANLDLNYRLSRHWSIGLGLSYQHHVSSSQISSIVLNTSTRQDTIAIIETASNIETIEGPREFLTTTRQTHLRHQVSQQLLAPITIRYTTSFSKVWDVHLGIGYGLSLWSNYNGFTQDPLDIAYDLRTDVDSRLNSRGPDRLILESYLTRNIAGLGKVKLGINYLHDLNGRYSNDNIIQKKSHLLQLNGGLIIPLNF